jgi:hypothetical protein
MRPAGRGRGWGRLHAGVDGTQDLPLGITFIRSVMSRRKGGEQR